LGSSIDILGLGSVAVDDLLFVAAYPEPDTKVVVQRRERRCGGLTATALVAARRAGARCAYAGLLGDDELSAYMLACLRQEGVDLEHVARHPEARPIHSTIIASEQQGTRNIFADIPALTGADPVRPAAELICACRLFLMDDIGAEGMLRAGRLAREAGIPVVADLERDRVPRFAELLAVPDHLILPFRLGMQIAGTETPEGVLDALWTEERRTVVVTRGSEGCWFRDRAASTTTEHQPAFAVRAVDTTGCGDVFHGAYAAALLRGLDCRERVRWATATAALKATRTGGWAGIPAREEVEVFLHTHRDR
jgi:ribokinase